MKFAPEGHDYNGFTQYFFEGKELEFLEILLSGKDKQQAILPRLFLCAARCIH